MKRNERIQNIRASVHFAAVVIFVAINGAFVFAQTALDGSLHVGSGGVNTTPTPAPRPVRRESSEARNLSQSLGLRPNDDFIKTVNQQTGGRSGTIPNQSTNNRNAGTQPNGVNDLKRRDPLQFDSQGLALSIQPNRSMVGETMPFAKYRLNNGETGIISANNLRGVKFESERNRLGSSRLSLYENARLREDVRNNTIQADFIGTNVRDPFKSYQSGDAVAAKKAPPPKDRSMSLRQQPFDNRVNGYDSMMIRVKQRFEDQLQSNQKTALDGEMKSALKDRTNSEEQLLSVYDQLKRELVAKEVQPKTNGSSTTTAAVDTENEKRPGIHMTIDEYAMVLKHGQKLNSMTGEEKNRFNQLLSEGQRAMYEGNAFFAEKRFQVALAIRPDDPLAIAGMLHCQISANLLASAAMTLRELFNQHPEMMDVDWGPQAIPPRARLDKALVETSRRMEIGKDAAQFGLLHAYIGHLLNNQDAVTVGLFALRGTPGDDSMATILKALWVDTATDKSPQKINTPVAPNETPKSAAPPTTP